VIHDSPPPFGIEKVAVGGGLGGGVEELLTLTLIPTEVSLPAASCAVAPRRCVPLVAVVVSHDIEYGEEVSSPARVEPSTWKRTPTTPALSEALAETTIVPKTVAPSVGAVSEMIGAVVSGLLTVTETPADVV